MEYRTHISVQDLNVYFRSEHVLKNINLSIPDRKITAIIGPSGCGKTTLLRSFNRLIDSTEGVKVSRPGPGRRREHPRPEDRGDPYPEKNGAAAAEALSAAHVDLRQRGLRAAHPRHQGQEAPRRDRRALPEKGQPLGRGQGQAAASRPPRSPSASSSASAWPAAWPSSPRSSSATSRHRPSTPSPASASSRPSPS